MDKLCNFITNLLNFNPANIFIGRCNREISDFDINFIVVDNLSIENLGTGREYDGDGEVMTYSTFKRYIATIDFYGAGAYTLAETFENLLRSQKARDLQRTLQISVNLPTDIQDLKIIAGSYYSNRIQLTLNIDSFTYTDIDTKRYDTAEIQYIYER